MAKHTRYGGSTAARTLACPAWHKQADSVPRPPANTAALLGTALHTIVEKCLNDTELDPYAFDGRELDGQLITVDLIDSKIWPALDAFETLMDRFDVATYEIERYYEMRHDIAGTCDFIGFSADGSTVVLADYKSGDGHMVYAENNAQGLFYAMCARAHGKLNGVTTLVIAIVQPSDRRDEVLDVWVTDMDTLDAFIHDYLDAVKTSESDCDPVAGPHCRFCPAEALCPTKKGLVQAQQSLPDVRQMQMQELGHALKLADGLESWIRAVKKMAHEQLTEGVSIPGYKLVDKRATRVWSDPEAVQQVIKNSKKIKKEDAYTHKLLSPAQLEKVCKHKKVPWATFKPYIAKLSSGTTLTTADDPRPEIVTSASAKIIAARFKDVPETETEKEK